MKSLKQTQEEELKKLRHEVKHSQFVNHSKIEALFLSAMEESFKEGYIQGGIDEINKVVNILSDQNNVTPSSNSAG